MADLPLLLYDDYGRKPDTGKGSLTEQIFGAVITDYYNTFNAPRLKLNELEIHGQFGALALTRAKTAASFADNTPAIVESSFGKGTTALMNFEASRMAFKPGAAGVEGIIVRTLLGASIKPKWSADGALAYRRAAPRADHYFFINGGEARAVTLAAHARDYARGEDALSQERIAVTGRAIRIELPARSGRWIRMEKR